MNKIIIICFLTFTSLLSYANDLELKGILDFDLISGGYSGKAIHLIVNNNISDLSRYGIGVANNGNGSHGEEFSFPNISLQAGNQIFLARDTAAMIIYLNNCFYNFDYIMLAPIAIDQNGNDAIELYKDSIVIETFGDVNIDGTGTDWDYLDSWAYKDPLGSVTFSGKNWIFGGVECTIGSLTTQTSSCIYPFCDANVSVDDQHENKLSIFPNPSSDFIFLDNDVKIIDFEIYNIMGKKMNNYRFENSFIDINSLSDGVYILLIFDHLGFSTQKTFIKN
jgi:hypothetical protein